MSERCVAQFSLLRKYASASQRRYDVLELTGRLGLSLAASDTKNDDGSISTVVSGKYKRWEDKERTYGVCALAALKRENLLEQAQIEDCKLCPDQLPQQ